MLAYGNEPSMHLVHKQEAALPGDLSLPRGMIISIADALEEEEENGFKYDAFINLTDGMIPITKKKDLEDYLNKYPEQDIYYVEKTSCLLYTSNQCRLRKTMYGSKDNWSCHGRY